MDKVDFPLVLVMHSTGFYIWTTEVRRLSTVPNTKYRDLVQETPDTMTLVLLTQLETCMYGSSPVGIASSRRLLGSQSRYDVASTKAKDVIDDIVGVNQCNFLPNVPVLIVSRRNNISLRRARMFPCSTVKEAMVGNTMTSGPNIRREKK